MSDGVPTVCGPPEGRHLSLQRKRLASSDMVGSLRDARSAAHMIAEPRISEILADGNPVAMDALIPEIYASLRQLAHRQRAHEAAHTLQTTALVNEACLKLLDNSGVTFADRAHLYAYMSRMMRHLLIDRARRKKAQKRQAPEMTEGMAQPNIIDVLALDEALTRLAALDERLARVAELRLFAELSSPDIADAIGINARTVERDWLKARTFLSACLAPET